jgi:hypothetical protein
MPGRKWSRKQEMVFSLLFFRSSVTPPDTTYSPTQNEADQKNDQKHQSAGHGDGPGEKCDIYCLHILKDEDECEKTKNDP